MQEIKLLGFLKDDIPSEYRKQLYKLIQEFELETSKYPTTIDFVKDTFESILPEEIKEYWVLAFIEDEMIGYGYCDWQIMFDNLDKGSIRLFVKKEYRRKKVASDMLRFLLVNTDEQVSIFNIMTYEGTVGEIYLRNLRGRLVFTEKMIVSHINEFTYEEIENAVSSHTGTAHKNGFSIEFIPQTKLLALTENQQFVKMIERNLNAMPHEDQKLEDAVMTSERLRESFNYRIKRKDEFFTVIAIHQESKKFAGYTMTRVNKNLPEVGIQHDTGVLSEYRGNRLGLTMKYQLLQQLKNNTSVIFWETGSAASNIYMERINVILKHKPLKTKLVFEFTKDKLRTVLNTK
ncbi:MAG: GNAT family N-acetyltransferase [Candidatus Heimdallarchaeota archaeon]